MVDSIQITSLCFSFSLSLSLSFFLLHFVFFAFFFSFHSSSSPRLPVVFLIFSPSYPSFLLRGYSSFLFARPSSSLLSFFSTLVGYTPLTPLPGSFLIFIYFSFICFLYLHSLVRVGRYLDCVDRRQWSPRLSYVYRVLVTTQPLRIPA